MKRSKLLFLLLGLSLSFQVFAQKKGWYDTVYLHEFMYSKYFVAEREFYQDGQLIKTEKYSGNKQTDNISRAEFYYYSNEKAHGFGFGWSIHYDTFLLAIYRRYRDIRTVDSSYYLYKNKGNPEYNGSVMNFTGYINGKEVERDYAPGEFYLDYQINPDTIPAYFRKLVGDRRKD